MPKSEGIMAIRTLAVVGWATLAPFGLRGQSAPSHPAFEVASVKPNPLPPGAFGFGSGGGGGAGIHISGNRVTLVRHSLLRLVMTAYDLKDFQISGMPEWALGRDQLYDITAKVEGEGTPALEQVRPMLQTLLADRFQLKLHRETKELPVYNLVVDKKGPKLKDSAGARPPQPVTFSGPLVRFNLLDKSMAELVDIITGFVDRPVLEKTGLTGRYDFTLEFTRSNPDLVAPDSPEAERSIFPAIQEQLGLKLAPAKEPTGILVIDHAERPSEN